MSSPVHPQRERLTGVCPAAQGCVVSGLIRRHDAPVWLVVTAELKAAETLAEDIRLFGGPDAADLLVFPESMPDHRDMRETFAASSDRLTVLSRLRARRQLAGAVAGDRPLVVVTTPAALLQSVPSLGEFATRELTLAKGQTQSFQGLLEQLAALDYDCEAVCESPGHYAIRGGIIDVYPVTANEPYRLDFFGDTIEEIRAFDPVTQRSAATLESISLSASPRVRLDPSRTGLAEYLSPASRLLLVEPAALAEEFRSFENSGAGWLPAITDRCRAIHAVGDLDEAVALLDGAGGDTLDTESLAHHRTYPGEALIAQERLQVEEDARRKFLRQLAAWRKEGCELVFVAPKDGEEQRMGEILATEPALKKPAPRFLRGALNEGFRVTFREGGSRALFDDLLSPGRVRRSATALGALSSSKGSATAGQTDESVTGRAATPSFAKPSAGKPLRAGSGDEPGGEGTRRPTGIVVVTETEIFGRQRSRRPALNPRAGAARAQVDQLLDFAELVEGDFVVHLQHGIAHYRGITTLDTAQGPREVISLEFDDKVTLHVPLQESHLVSRYVGLSKVKPQLGRIGSGRWEKSRQAAERATVDLAAELLRIQAEREAQPGHAFPADNEWQREFEASFPFTETPDQLRAIGEAKADMEKTRPMDRLICGDVGFGKTEVAIRAAFKSVQGGRQVAVLVPTTVLAQQHLNSFRERMAAYPVAVEMLSRFRTRAEQARILEAAAAGQVDILIGTHRLLQKDVAFRDLGLVVVDEEQRFGVKHKEALKRLRTTVDVLSMSATPIPRTLHLALTGARDMSVIETAPTNRHPIQTIVKSYDDQLVVDAVKHEIRRGGQVFYLHNRVATIEETARRLRILLPDLTIGVGHGQMDANELERTMTDFVAGRYQLLVCTTIIESGLDLPNCNTIIIEGADRFGLAQLYQLRGRVGRFKHQAYAYLLLHRHTRLLEAARQRLGAMRTHNQLGAGFRIAMRDLELRGAGNLLGAEQSGHIAGVGFELYCQLLRQSVARLKGDKHAGAHRATVKLDFVQVGEAAPSGDRRRYADSYTALRDAEHNADGTVPVDTIIARIPPAYISETRLRIDFYRKLAMAGNLQQLRALEGDLRDRFGKFGDDVKALLLLTEIRIRAEQKGLLSVETDASRLKCLRHSARRDDWVQVGSRFPRLTAPRPLLRLREIVSFLSNLP